MPYMVISITDSATRIIHETYYRSERNGSNHPHQQAFTLAAIADFQRRHGIAGNGQTLHGPRIHQPRPAGGRAI